MPTVTFTIASSADDGAVERLGAWPPAGTATADDGTTTGVKAGQGGGNYYTHVALFRWDTSSIPEDATIVSATFGPWCHARGAGDAQPWAMVGDYYDFGGEPSVSGDWIFECSPSIFNEVLISSIASSDTRIQIPLTDLSGINKSGYTGIRCSFNNTARSAPPSDSLSQILLQAYEMGGNPARLVVEYYVGTPLTFTIASAGDDGSIWRSGTFPPTGAYNVDDGTLAYAAKGTNYANVALFRWDTSSIPDGATITGADFKPHLEACNDVNSMSLVGDYYDFGGEPSVAADWTLECSPSIFTAMDLTVIDPMIVAGGEQLTISLTDLTGINKSGYTGIRCSLDNPGTPSTDNSVVFRTFEHAANQPAELFVAYTESGAVTITQYHLDSHNVTPMTWR